MYSIENVLKTENVSRNIFLLQCILSIKTIYTNISNFKRISVGNKKENGFNEEFKGGERRSKNRRRKDEGQIEPKLFEKGIIEKLHYVIFDKIYTMHTSIIV